MTGARYRLVHGDGQAEENGQADVRIGDGALVLTLGGDDVLRVPFGLITATGPADGFAIRISLADGNMIELTQLGRMRTQLLAELRDGRAGRAADAAGTVGEAEIFPAEDADGPAEARVYEDALLVTGTTGTERIGFSFMCGVSVADYAVTVTVLGRPPLVLSRLGRRTGEFAGLLTARRADARVRTSALLAAVLPQLDPDRLRQAAAELRDGVAVPVTTLDRIAPGTAAALLERVTAPDRRDAVAELAGRTALAIGFRQVRSVRREAVGATAWRDPAVVPHIGAHGDPGSLGGGWYGGYGGYGSYPGWGFFGGSNGFGGNTGQWHAMTPRADVSRGQLIPAADELSALTTAADQPTVIAFVLGRTADRVVFDVISQTRPAGFVYRADGPDGLAVINRELDNTGFSPPDLDGPPPGTPARPPAGSAAETAAGPQTGRLVGRAVHGPGWAAELGALLGPVPGQGPR